MVKGKEIRYVKVYVGYGFFFFNFYKYVWLMNYFKWEL